MRKKLVILGLLIFYTFSAKAQLLRLGVSGGAVLKQMELSSAVVEKANWNGWYIGPTLEVKLPLGFCIDGSALYSHGDLDCSEDKMGVNSLSIPLNVKYVVNCFGTLGVYVSGGYQFDTLIKGNEKDLLSTTVNLKESSRSINVGGGIRVLDHIQVGVTYNIPQCSTEGSWLISGQSSSDMKMKNSWRIGAVVLF